jgi:hypothetical protein
LTDWSTVASLATAGGTLILAIATFGATRTANRAARTAERAFEARLRPVLVQSRREDPVEKIMWGDRHWSRVPGGQAWVEEGPDAIYLAMSLRNVGAGMAVIHGWHAESDLQIAVGEHAAIETFRPQSRDLYVPPGDTSFWQGAFREGDEDARARFGEVIRRRDDGLTVELLYGDLEGGQRTISRFTLVPFGDDPDDPSTWIVSVTRHWNVDRDEPR